MKLSEVKNKLDSLQKIAFQLPDGSLVPSHFHVTEIGMISKQFIDCGGNLRREEVINFQLWNANDYNHRLHPEKLIAIIQQSEKVLNLKDLEIEVEYQGSTIQKFGLGFNGTVFELTPKHTDCLAKENCGIPTEKPKKQLSDLSPVNQCSPGGNCC